MIIGQTATRIFSAGDLCFFHFFPYGVVVLYVHDARLLSMETYSRMPLRMPFHDSGEPYRGQHDMCKVPARQSTQQSDFFSHTVYQYALASETLARIYLARLHSMNDVGYEPLTSPILISRSALQGCDGKVVACGSSICRPSCF